MKDRVWASRIRQAGNGMIYMKRVRLAGWICFFLPFFLMLLSVFSDTIYLYAMKIAIPAFVVAILCYFLWIAYVIKWETFYRPEEVLRWCPVSKNGQLYFLDLTDPGVLELLGERELLFNQLEMRLVNLQERLMSEEYSERILSNEMIERFGIHAFWVKQIRSDSIGVKCVCWFGRDDNNKDIHHTFRFYQSIVDPEQFKQELMRFHEFAK